MLVFDLIEKLQAVSPAVANVVLGQALPQIIPLTGGLGMRVHEVTGERAVASLPLRRRTRNHVGSVYFGAQMTLAEITMGLLVFRRYPPGPYSMLVKRVEADFRAKAKGTLRAVCDPGREVLETLDAVRTAADGKAEAWLPVQLLDAGGAVVTEARFLAALKRFGNGAA
jgi:acyl-coenzyme A thioesterase PaaI-like protein